MTSSPRFLVGTAITVICIGVGVYFVDWSEMVHAFAAVNLEHLVPAVVLIMGAHTLWAMRWHGLIGVKSLPLLGVFRYMMIACLANGVMPARPGGVVRLVLLKKRGQIAFSRGLASMFVERLFDMVALCTLALSISFIVTLPGSVTLALNLIGGASLSLLLLLVLLNRNSRWLPLQVQKRAFFKRRWAVRVVARLEDFATALDILRSPRGLIRCALLTAVGWSLFAGSLYVLSLGFDLSSPPVAILLVMVTTNLGAVIPASPGSLGIYHFMAVMALSVWKVDLNVALAYAICAHALSLAIQIVAGILSVWAENMQLSGLSALADDGLKNAS